MMCRPPLQTLVLLFRAGRLHFLLAGFLLYLLGALYAIRTGSLFSLFAFLSGYAVCGTAHLSVSYSNDYFDRFSDDPEHRSMFSGGSGVLPRHPELAGTVLGIAAALSAASLAGTAILVLGYGFPAYLPAFVAAGLALGWGYSAPPFRLSCRGLGEIATMAAFGVFLPGAGYLFLSRSPDPAYLWLMVPLFLAGLFFIVSVELPDYETDRKTAKRTLVVRLGPKKALMAAVAAVAIAALLFLLAGAAGGPPAGFFPVMGAGLFILLLAGTYGIFADSTDFSTASRITGINITAIVLFILTGIGALAAGL